MMKLALNMYSVNALRKLAAEIPETMSNIVYSTNRLLSTYHAVSDTLGAHEPDFYNMVLSVKHAQEVSREALEAIPNLLTATADKIEDYINWHPTLQRSSAEEVEFKSYTVDHITAPSDNQQIRHRTIFEITTLMNSLELSDGDPTVFQAGGPYRDVKKCVDSTLYEVHHIPPQSVFTDSFDSLPSIAMLKQDHAKTSSYKGKMNKTYQPIFPSEVVYPRHKQGVKDLIEQGLLAEAIRNEIYELRAMFGSKYDGAIKEYLNSMLEYVRNNGIPIVKE